MTTELTEEERRLLAENPPPTKDDDDPAEGPFGEPEVTTEVDKPKRRGRKAAAAPEVRERETPSEEPATQRGILTPAQYDGDGWLDTPVQMRD